MSSERRVRNRISPIQMNSGSAVRVQLEAAPNIVVAIASPAGRVVNIHIAMTATPIRLSPIQMPLASSANRATMRMSVVSKSVIGRSAFHVQV